jgi:hypothetical protein
MRPTRAHHRKARIRLWLPLIALCVTAGCSASAGSVPAAKASSPQVPNGWRVVSYHGVHVEVPAGWPVVDGMHTLFCGGPFPTTPTAFVGPQENGAPSCPASLLPTPRDGVWLQLGSRPSDARPRTLVSGQTILEEDLGTSGSVEIIYYHGVLVEIGIGADPHVATAILNSIGFTSGAPDSPAAGICARSANPETMPTPERAAAPLVLERGNITIDPPLPSDHPTTSAEQAWKADTGPKQSFERYRLLLARYSASFPARQNPDGSLTPQNQNELAWVIYSSPYSAAIAGCGMWGVSVADAHSGQEVISAGWAPGP